MRQTLSREQLKALYPCDDRYLGMFGEHKRMNIEQAFEAGFTICNICWLMGALHKRKEIIEFANFCAKQVNANWNINPDWSDWFAAVNVARAAGSADWAVLTPKVDGAAIRKEQKQFLMELLK